MSFPCVNACALRSLLICIASPPVCILTPEKSALNDCSISFLTGTGTGCPLPFEALSLLSTFAGTMELAPGADFFCNFSSRSQASHFNCKDDPGCDDDMRCT